MDFFATHGILFLLGLAIFPRITLLISSVVSGGLLWWLGFIFCPHLLVAILATPFFSTNPVLVVIAWFLAFAGTKQEVDSLKSGELFRVEIGDFSFRLRRISIR